MEENVCDNERKDVPFNFQVNRKQKLDITGNLGDRREWMDRDVYYKTTQVEESAEVKKRAMNNLKTFTPRVIKMEEMVEDGKLDIAESNQQHAAQHVGQMSRCLNNSGYRDTLQNNEIPINLSLHRWWMHEFNWK